MKEELFSKNKKKLNIITYGCQMNVYDSERMASLMEPFGFEVVEDYNDADMVILNTCHIREKAAEKVYSELGRINQRKQSKISRGDDMAIVVAGCVAQAEGEEVFRRAPFVDIVVGPQSYHTLPELLTRKLEGKKKLLNLDFPEVSKFDLLPEESLKTGPSAFLSVQEGCDKFCTFCVVPYTRGAEYSRPVGEVYREAIKLTNKGTLEINLLGQNVNAYHGVGPENDIWNLGKLISELAKLDSLKRIRYTTSHPRDMHEDLYKAHANEPKLMPFLHLPVQSGSNRVLKEMNRKHSRDEYLDIIARLREARPDLAFSSDFIVGFPGETDKDFEDTLDIVKQVGYAQCYSFKYSPRPGTPASIKDNMIPEEVKSERLTILQDLIYSQQIAFNEGFVGKEVEVLFDRKGKLSGQVLGKTPYNQSVYVENAGHLYGQITKIRITKASSSSLTGEII